MDDRGSTGNGSWSRAVDYAHGGVAYGTDYYDTTDTRLAMLSSIAVPAGARLYFDHSYGFEAGTVGSVNVYYDGAVLEYSANDGATWSDASSLIEAGKAYGGTVLTTYGNPLGGRSVFVGDSWGFTGSRVGLASLANKTVRFRFRIGTDNVVGDFGWFVDNVRIYTCGPVAPAITSPNSTTFIVGTPGSFTVIATGAPIPGITATGTLPSGVTFVDNGNGTATLSGTPAAGTAAVMGRDITATNSQGSREQDFTLGVAVFVTDRDSVTVPEGGTTTFQVKLNQQPPSTVTATVSRVSGDTDITVQSGASLTFTTANWGTYQTVTLAGAEDADTTSGTATIRISAGGLSTGMSPPPRGQRWVWMAVHDSTLKVPACAAAGLGCDSGTLLNGRDNMTGGRESNQPNTLFSSCADGTHGSYHSTGESLD